MDVGVAAPLTVHYGNELNQRPDPQTDQQRKLLGCHHGQLSIMDVEAVTKKANNTVFLAKNLSKCPKDVKATYYGLISTSWNLFSAVQ